MTLTSLCFGVGLGSKMEENVAVEDSGGIGVVTDIGLWMEKNDDMWISSEY